MKPTFRKGKAAAMMVDSTLKAHLVEIEIRCARGQKTALVNHDDADRMARMNLALAGHANDDMELTGVLVALAGGRIVYADDYIHIEGIEDANEAALAAFE